MNRGCPPSNRETKTICSPHSQIGEGWLSFPPPCHLIIQHSLTHTNTHLACVHITSAHTVHLGKVVYIPGIFFMTQGVYFLFFFEKNSHCLYYILIFIICHTHQLKCNTSKREITFLKLVLNLFRSLRPWKPIFSFSFLLGVKFEQLWLFSMRNFRIYISFITDFKWAELVISCISRHQSELSNIWIKIRTHTILKKLINWVCECKNSWKPEDCFSHE